MLACVNMVSALTTILTMNPYLRNESKCESRLGQCSRIAKKIFRRRRIEKSLFINLISRMLSKTLRMHFMGGKKVTNPNTSFSNLFILYKNFFFVEWLKFNVKGIVFKKYPHWSSIIEIEFPIYLVDYIMKSKYLIKNVKKWRVRM